MKEAHKQSVPKSITDKFEYHFENSLFGCRWFVIIAVIGSLAASVIMFVSGFFAILHGVSSFVSDMLAMEFFGTEESHQQLVLNFISAVDKFLFATVLLIFSKGLYELFVSRIDPINRTAASIPGWLRMTSLEDLKTYLGKVVLMILIVLFFEQSVSLEYRTPVDLLCLAGGVVLVALSLYLTHGRLHSRAKEHQSPAKTAVPEG